MTAKCVAEEREKTLLIAKYVDIVCRTKVKVINASQIKLFHNVQCAYKLCIFQQKTIFLWNADTWYTVLAGVS
jgi:hypothetical protein